MMELIRENWLPFALALLIGFLVAWWLFARASRLGRLRERERSRRPDALDEGAAPAQRNQSLIDAPSAAAAAAITPPPMGETMAGIGEAVAVAAQQEAQDAALARPTPPLTPPPVTPPVTPSVTPSATATATQADDLRRIKGVGPKLVVLLNGLAVTRFDQIAAWNDADIDRIDARLGAFAGRIRRDNWVEQARLLADGDKAGYEARFGRL